MSRDLKKIWVWGRHAVCGALSNPRRKIYGVYACSGVHQDLFADYKIEKISPSLFDQWLPRGCVHQGIAAQVSPLEGISLNDVTNGPLLILDHLTDPQNIGAIWRSAAAFGVKGIVISHHHSPALEGVIAKAACGALDKVSPIFVSNITYAIDALRKKQFYCLGMCERANSPLGQIKDIGKEVLALVIGSEGVGLRPIVRKACDWLIKIPTNPEFPTLNASVAVAICLYTLNESIE